jgi:hypothetical protein
LTLDVSGNFGGILTRWKNIITLQNYALIVLGIWSELGLKLLVINVYGPYEARQQFWDGLFSLDCVHDDKVFIGGDLNFTLNQSKVLGLTGKLLKP